MISSGFGVSNGVRQGGILSPYLFCVYMDDLSNKLNDIKVGCTIGATLINHLMYADDLVCVYHLFVRNNVGTIEYRSINKNKLSD